MYSRDRVQLNVFNDLRTETARVLGRRPPLVRVTRRHLSSKGILQHVVQPLSSIPRFSTRTSLPIIRWCILLCVLIVCRRHRTYLSRCPRCITVLLTAGSRYVLHARAVEFHGAPCALQLTGAKRRNEI